MTETEVYYLLMTIVYSIVVIAIIVISVREVIRKKRRGLTKRASDVACATSYHDAFIIVYGYCPVCSGKTPRR